METRGLVFGKRVLQARLTLAGREGRSISQAEVAEKMGVHQKTVATWEHGKKEPDLDTIARLAELLGTSPAYLAFGIPDAPLREVSADHPRAVPVIGTVNADEKPGKGKPKP